MMLRTILSFGSLLVLGGFMAGTRDAAAGDEVRLFVATPLPKSAQLAVDELRAALTAHGDTVREATAVPKPDEPAIIVGVARESETFAKLLEDAKLAMPDLAESTAAAWFEGRERTLLLAGADERGLVYALRDAARGIAVTPRETEWPAGITPAVESPRLRVRNVTVHLFNADCERAWYFSEEFWRFYFDRLALSRFNRCTVTFCDQTNYLCPPYAYLVEMPEYPNVKVDDCTTEQRAANLAMLRRIAELADEYAIDFDLGIWMQAPVAKWAAPVKVSGLPEGLELASYCALGLRRIYEACPSLDGVQLRMNAEAGVSEEQQTAFYQPLFAALAAVGRPLRVELRYKGLQQATIDAAVAAGLDVTVSTKFWAEHFGPPYHPTVVDSHYAADRYSFGTLLKRPRNYRVTYQLWTVGSQRVTLWGDPDYAARFAESCTLGGGEGFEVFAPLTNKGYGNAPGAWEVIKDPAYRVGKWEQERYWMFYLCFGRMGFNPQTNAEVWRREFRDRFGAAADYVEKAYRAASQVLPAITAQLLPSASEWYWWPEMDTGGNLAEYARVQTSDPGQFAAVRQWERTPDWPWEDWDARPGFIEDRVAKTPDGRRTPLAMIREFESLARSIDTDWTAATNQNHDEHAEWRVTAVDLQILRRLAEFHAAKLSAATNWSIYDAAKQNSHLEAAVRDLARAVAAWRELVRATEGVYYERLVFGLSPENTRSKFGLHHSGHWRDRLAEIEADHARLRTVAAFGNFSAPWPLYEMQLSRRDALYGKVHRPPAKIDPEMPLVLEFETGFSSLNGMDATDEPQRIVVHVRSLDQTRPWTAVEMQRDGETEFGRTWRATVPRDVMDPQRDLQYYFTLIHAKSPTWNWGDVERRRPYFVVPVEAP